MRMYIYCKGHIFSTILGIPHILIDNKIGKLSAYHRTWTHGCPKAHRGKDRIDARGLANLYFDNQWLNVPTWPGYSEKDSSVVDVM